MTYDKIELALLALPADADLGIIEPQTSRVDESVAIVLKHHHIVLFKGRLMIEVDEPYPHFTLLTREHFTDIAYPLLGLVKRSHLNNVFEYLSHMAPDLSHNDHFLLFGNSVWDMDTLEVRSDIAPTDCVWRSPYSMKSDVTEPIPFIMSLVGYNPGLYDDIMQSLAPLVVGKKPDGIIWWIGNDARGKDMLMDAINQIFPDQLANLSLKTLIGGRYTLGLNSVIGNVAEGGIAHIEDTQVYKSISTHQSFSIRRYHGQKGIEIKGNVHHIFSAITAPTFNARQWQAIDWRTHTIPFNRQSDDSRAPTLTDNDISHLILEMCRYAVQIKNRGYRYKWSAATRAAKVEYYPENSKLDVARSHPISTAAPFRW